MSDSTKADEVRWTGNNIAEVTTFLDGGYDFDTSTIYTRYGPAFSEAGGGNAIAYVVGEPDGSWVDVQPGDYLVRGEGPGEVRRIAAENRPAEGEGR